MVCAPLVLVLFRFYYFSCSRSQPTVSLPSVDKGLFTYYVSQKWGCHTDPWLYQGAWWSAYRFMPFW